MDPTLALLAGAGGTALVQAMMSDAWAGVRDAAARLLGRGDAEHESNTLTLLDASRRSVRQATPGSEESVHATQSALWAARFAVVLENEPDRAVLLNALLSLAAAATATTPGANTQHISAGQNAYVAGRDQTLHFGSQPDGGRD